MCGEGERLVPNPYVTALERLKSRAETAVADTPNMDGPAEAIGDGPAWTGSAARDVHDDYLAPHADPVRSALNRLVEDIENRKSAFEPLVTEGLAEVLRIELEMW
ncbi:hypothetical protein [Phytoactinopolyspora mesophila]|uniref:Uncharacterized protein n=1 Tax=Phytoactinopolyspora mesophila TaxID=2650750 RepID=A0A7K3M6I7_9ACTN|nr:hypothetical protein [Phytoactinopolyspora mesophila]NDL58933.1 hypothetical protein [Phytoactinopolyspora mesophila]